MRTPERDGAGPPGVLCSGSIVYDILVRAVEKLDWGTTTFVECLEYHAGGNGANTSRALAAIGVPVRLIGTVGSDENGRFVLERLRASGVDTSRIETVEAPTAATVVLVNSRGDRKFLHRIGSSGDAFATPLDFTDDLTAGTTHYHLASLFVLPRLRAHAAEVLVRARAAGLSTSLDTNWDPCGLWMQDLEPCLPHLDYLFLNEDEARMVTGESDPAAAARIVLAKGARTAVLKLGSRGCAVYTPTGEYVAPAYNVPVRDTTGAGDCFVAGFLAARLHGADLYDAGQFANAIAALNVQNIGANIAVSSFNDVRQWMKSAALRVDATATLTPHFGDHEPCRERDRA